MQQFDPQPPATSFQQEAQVTENVVTYIEDDNSYNEPEYDNKDDESSEYEPTYYRQSESIDKLAKDNFDQQDEQPG